MDLAAQKQRLRSEALDRRARLARGTQDAGARLADNFFSHIDVPAGAVVSAFWPIGDEIDVRPLLDQLDERGVSIALPRVVAKGAPLVFHLWDGDAPLVPAAFGLMEPRRDWLEVAPDIVLVPLLLFDGDGYRLGYGGGYYDRTLARLRAEKTILAAGVAFSGQEADDVPHGTGDERLDWIVTEETAWAFAGPAFEKV